MTLDGLPIISNAKGKTTFAQQTDQNKMAGAAFKQTRSKG